MVDTLRITTGKKRIAIERDGQLAGEITFDPTDIIFAEKFYRLLDDFRVKQVEYTKRARELDAQAGTVGENGLPANLPGGIELVRDLCAYLRGQIDVLFGSGTSQIVFGDAQSLGAFAEFFDGIIPFIHKARSDRVARYLNQNGGGVMG